MYVGIDFGTTNTVAALVDGGEPRPLPIEGGAPALRTVLYVERDGAMRIGAEAIAAYREHNVGRVPRLIRQWVGEIEVEIGEFVVKGYDVGAGGTAVLDAYAEVDADAPGRLIHSLKAPLASDYRGTRLFGRDYALEELIAEFLSRVRWRIGQVIGQMPDRAAFGRPVHFAGAHSGADDARAQARLAQAAQLAGFREVAFELEPIGAGLSSRALSGLHAGAHAVVFDFGGGTLDVAVVRVERGGAQRVLATGGAGIGGDAFDRAIFRRAVLPWLGAGVRWGAQRAPLPAHVLAALDDWQDAPALANAETLRFLREAQANCTDPLRLLALEDVIAKGYAYDLFARVEAAKVALSSRRVAVIEYDAGAASVWQPLTRAQFEAMIAAQRREVGELVDAVLRQAGIAAADVACVARTGGSSSIPSFVALLGERFGAGRVAEHALFTGVAAGLAVRAEQLRLAMHWRSP